MEGRLTLLQIVLRLDKGGTDARTWITARGWVRCLSRSTRARTAECAVEVSYPVEMLSWYHDGFYCE